MAGMAMEEFNKDLQSFGGVRNVVILRRVEAQPWGESIFINGFTNEMRRNFLGPIAEMARIGFQS